MVNNIQAWLLDIQQAINEIFEFLPEERNFLVYRNDLKTKKAVERNLEIIGEAMNRILSTDENFPIKNARRIVDTRNRIVHGYDKISDEIIWAIVMNDLLNLNRRLILIFKEIATHKLALA